MVPLPRPCIASLARKPSSARMFCSLICAKAGQAMTSNTKTERNRRLFMVCVFVPLWFMFLLLSIFQVNRARLRIEIQSLRALLTHSETRFLSPTERKLILHSSSRKIHCDQPGFDPVNEFVYPRQIVRHNRCGKSKAHVVRDAQRIVKVFRNH